MPFDPREITPTASINRVKIVDLPGVALHDDERGKSAYDLLGARSVYGLIRERADVLGLPSPLPETPTDEVMTAFQACLTSKDAYTRQIAQSIRATVHRRIALLLAVLKRGDSINREARPEWDESYWAYWKSVNSLVIGGGLLRDKMGLTARGTTTEFQRMLAHFGVSMTVSQDQNGPYLPLIGAAGAAEQNNSPVAVLDFGGTSVKAGIARYVMMTLVKIESIIRAPSPLGEPYALTPPTEAQTQAVFQEMVRHISQAIVRSAYAPYIHRAIVSLAAYIDSSGHPYPNTVGGYAAMQTLAPNLQDAFTDAVSQQIGRSIQVTLLHDGTAAATLHQKPVLVFGTAIGVGTHAAVAAPSAYSYSQYHLEFSRKKHL